MVLNLYVEHNTDEKQKSVYMGIYQSKQTCQRWIHNHLKNRDHIISMHNLTAQMADKQNDSEI